MLDAHGEAYQEPLGARIASFKNLTVGHQKANQCSFSRHWHRSLIWNGDLLMAAYQISTPPAIDPCCATRYTRTMIKSFKHKGLKHFFESGDHSGVQPKHQKKLR